MSLINYLGTFDTLTAIWEAYPEGGKEGDYIIIGGEYYQWDKYSASWSLSAQIPNEDIVAEEDYFTPIRNGSDVMGDTSEQTNVFINFLGHFASLTEVWEVYPEGGKEGDYIIISEQRLWWNKYAQEWDNAIIASSDITDVEIDITLPSSCVNPLGRFDSLADAWRKHPEGGREGDYIQIAEDIYKWDKYLTAWINIKELPSSELMPIVPTFAEDVVEYSDGYINYIGTFDTLEQVWLVYPEGGKEGDYIIVDGERYRWNKLTNNWGEVDPDAETPARPVVSIFGDLHIHNDTVIGEKLYAEILNTFTTKRWIIEQGYLGVKDITPTLIMSNIVPDNVTIGIKDGKLVVIGGGTADSISWEDITNKPSWLEGEEGFVTISSEQTIRAHKNFEKGISVQGAPISYDAVKKVWIFDANMLVTGGLAWNSSIEGFEPKTITDAVMIDDSTLGRNENGEIYVKGGAGGGGSIEYPLTWSGYSSGSYDGSASKNIAIPSLLSQLTNDAGFATSVSVNSLLTSYVQKSTIKSELGISDWALASTKPSYTASEVGALSLNGGTLSGTLDLNPAGSVHRFRLIANNSYSYLQAGSASGNQRGAICLSGYYSSLLTSLRLNTEEVVITGNLAGEEVGRMRIVTDSTYSYIQAASTAAGHQGAICLSGYFATQLTSLKLHAKETTVTGDVVVTGEITQNSSLELKDVVDTRFLTLKELEKLKPYSFYWKDKRDDKLHAGAVADYVKPILPEVISTDKDDIHSMNYANAAWVVGTSLTPYVSKHEEEIERLKARVKYLEDKLKEC